MKKTRYTEEQTACALRQVELGTPVADLTLHLIWPGFRALPLARVGWIHHGRANAPSLTTPRKAVHNRRTSLTVAPML